jgi:crossover junction endodeoxyribonuclease RusA
MVIGKAGREYRQRAALELLEQNVPRESISGRLKVEMICYPPDRRRRDLDNLQKALLDALAANQVIEDDSNIDELHIHRGPVRKDGGITVWINVLADELSFPRRRDAR